VLAGSAVVFALLGWLAWTGPFLPSASELAGTEATTSEAALLEDGSSRAAPATILSCSRRERFIAAMDDDWRMVEAEFQSREDFTRRIQRM
jgi:hypothetical protein